MSHRCWLPVLLGLVVTNCLIAKEPTNKPFLGSSAPPLSPAEAEKKFQVPPGFEVRLFAAEPDVVNPVAMAFDERGRLWVVELYEYPNGAKPGTKGRDRVKVLEDTDGDGKADKVTVFCDGLSLATGIQVGNGGVYVGQAPYLYFYPIISDGPEGPKAGARQTLLTGFGLDDRHELLNSFCWGPDGWLYFTQGVFTYSLVKDPANPKDPGVKMDAGVARYNTRTRKFEVITDGISNQWGVDWDRAGNAFVSACVVDHIWHCAPGGVYQRQGGQPNAPYTYELLKPINKDKHRHYMAAYGGINVYQGNLFPEEYRGTVFMGNIHGNCIDHDKLMPDGASFSASDIRKATDTGEFLEANDDWFRPVSEQVGPDGALWLMDWYDKYPCYQNSQAPDLDRERGRVWRVVYTGNDKGKNIPINPTGDLGKMSDEQLVGLLSHDNVWQRRVAQRLLTERKTKLSQQLVDLLRRGKTLESRLAALCILNGTYELAEGALESLVQDREPAIRAWAARLTGERGEANPGQIARLTALAADPDPLVRSFVAYAARRLAIGETLPIITTLLKQPGTETDPILPFMIWMAAETKIGKEPKALFEILGPAALMSQPASLAFMRKAMHRIADTRDSAKLAVALASLEKLKEADPALCAAGLDGLLDVKQGVVPLNSDEVLARLQQLPDRAVAERATRLGAAWGNLKAALAMLKRVNDPTATEEDRISAIRVARELKSDEARAGLLAVLQAKNSEKLKLEAIRGLSELGSDEAADVILKDWQAFTPENRRAIAEVMATRLQWASRLLRSVQRKQVDATEIPLTAARAMSRQKDKVFLKLLADTIGVFRESPEAKVKLIDAKKKVVMNGSPDLKAGREIMTKTCLVCHKFYGEGGDVGPDLTGVGRSSIDALLANVIDPSQIIGKGYENTIVETKDGRLLTGRLTEDTEDHVKLVSQGPKEEIVARNQIAKMRTEANVSVMPEGLEQMPDADFRNLIWYVFSPPQEKKPK
jgi:putative membrane-bound dehydrogenase-like protein